MKYLAGKPVGNRKVAFVANNPFLVNMEKEKFKVLNKRCSRRGNCPSMVTPKCNTEIWKSNLTSSYKMNERDFQRIENFHVKVAYAMTVASDKTMSSNILQEQNKELTIPL